MLYLLVSCSKAKRFPSEALRIQDVSGTSFSQIQQHWKTKVKEASPVSVASELYKGAYWTEVRKIVEHPNLSIELLIASAGLGLLRANQSVPSYAATFSAGNDDSIPKHSSKESSSEWFQGMDALSDFKKIMKGTTNPFLIVSLSEVYLKANITLLNWFIQQFGSDRLIVMGAKNFKHSYPTLQASWITLQERMTHELGGTVGNLNINATRWILQGVQSLQDINHARFLSDISKLHERTKDQQSRLKQGKKKTESEIRIWLQEAFKRDTPPTSKTAALRQFRSEGWACEEKKFKQMFVEEQNRQQSGKQSTLFPNPSDQ